MNADNDSSASGFMASQYEGINHDFTEFLELPSHEYCGLYKAKRYGRWFLLKFLKPEYREQAVYQQMLRKEFEILMSLQHPSVLQVVGMEDVFMPDRSRATCLITEWIDGETLKDFLKTNPNRQERSRIALDIAEALAYIHSQQIAHRDLKPSNIMVTHNGHNAKIIDFGLSDTDAHAILKQPAGTLQYMAPEQMQSSVSDCRNDIYSYGLILEELDLGRSYHNIIRKCLLPIERRYQNMDLLIADIKKKQKKRWGIVLLAVVLLLAITALWSQLKDAQERTERLNLNAHAINREIKELKKENIVFADKQVKFKCVQNWDTDHDGELSYQEAAAVKDIGNVFTGDVLINSFEELEHFTGLTSIAKDAFNGCINLQSLKMPETIIEIHSGAFRGTGLHSIILPSRSVTFGDHVMDDCPNLETVLNLSVEPQTMNEGTLIFQNCPKLSALFVPKSTAEDYKKPTRFYRWDEWGSIIYENISFDDPEVKRICVNLWDSNKDQELNVEEAMAVKDIGQAFTGNSAIRSFNELKYFTGLTKIGLFAFMGCSHLTNIQLPQTIKVIEHSAFRNCHMLRRLKLPDGLEKIGSLALRNCESLDSLFIPSHTTDIAHDALYNCLNLKTIEVSSENPRYDSRDNCNSIIETNINQIICGGSYSIIPNSVVSTSPLAYAGKQFKNLTIPAAFKSIGSWSLCAITVKESIYMESSIPPRYDYQGGLFEIFPRNNPLLVIYIPYGSMETYQHAYAWDMYAKFFREYPARVSAATNYGPFVAPQIQNLMDSLPQFDFKFDYLSTNYKNNIDK